MKYNYLKYTAAERYDYTETTVLTVSYGIGDDEIITVYPAIQLDTTTGDYIGVGASITKKFREIQNDVNMGADLYYPIQRSYLNAPGIYHKTFMKFLSFGSSYYDVEEYHLDRTLSHYVKGTYLTTVQAENGTYPFNGLHLDGYWYTRSSEVNEPPTKPVLLTPNGGEIITAPFLITWHPSTDINSNTAITYQVELTVNNGRDWTRIGNVQTTELLFDFAGQPDTSTAKIRVRAYDGSLTSDWDESDEVFSISYNYPPNPPYDLKPTTGDIVDSEKTVRFQWVHSDPNGSDPQSKFDIVWRLAGESVWNYISETTPRQYQDVPSFTLPVGEIEWQVRTYDQAGLVSEWSPIYVFTSGSKPETAAWIFPTHGQKITVAKPVFQWSSNVQTAYRVILYDANDFILWDTGEVEGTTKAVTSGVTLEDGGIYSVSVLIRNPENFWSEESKVSFTTSYSPPPKPTLNVYPGDATVVVEIDNPVSTGLEPQTVSNEVYKLIENEWVRIAKDIPISGIFVDYAARSNVAEQYRVKAVGDNEGIQYSDIKNATMSFSGVYIHDTTDAELTVRQFKYDGSGRSSKWSSDYSMMKFKGRKMPVVEQSENEERVIEISLMIKDAEDLFALESLARSYNTLCYRDGRGRLLFGFIPGLSVNDERGKYYSVNFNFIGIDYQGSV